jgi:putative ABC transport system substrate-binding protein
VRRRTFLSGLGGAAAWPFAAAAQSAAGKPVVAILWPSTEKLDVAFLAAIRDGLKAEGYVDGQNLALEMRNADGDFSRFPALAAELAALKPRVIATTTDLAVRIVRSTMPTVPLVAVLGSDPVAQGYAQSLARPGGMVTGVKTGVDIAPAARKRLSLLKEAMPQLARLGVLFDPSFASDIETLDGVKSVAADFGLVVMAYPVRSQRDVEPAFRAGIAAQAEAFFVSGNMFSYHAEVAAAALRVRRGATALNPEFVRDGLLMSYGADFLDLWRQIAPYIARILRGASPGDLPIAQPTKFSLTINLKTATALGLTIPPTLLARADEVIE